MVLKAPKGKTAKVLAPIGVVAVGATRIAVRAQTANVPMDPVLTVPAMKASVPTDNATTDNVRIGTIGTIAMSAMSAMSATIVAIDPRVAKRQFRLSRSMCLGT